MGLIPESVKYACIIPFLRDQLIHQGKVRDSYRVYPDWLKCYALSMPARLVVATDRISIFDFILNATIRQKGEILTALTFFWLTQILHNFPHHLLINGKSGRNLAYHFVQDLGADLPLTRCLAVKEVPIPPYEKIFRFHIGGSVWDPYCHTGIVAGQTLPRGLRKWDKLTPALFTPSTKSEDGHDRNITIQEYLKATGERGVKSMEMFKSAYQAAYDFAAKRGIRILDTKFEGDDVIADEVLTTDSSRFTTDENWRESIAQGREPVFYDKEVVRIWGKKVITPFRDEQDEEIVGINKLNPENPEHVKFVHSLTLPTQVVEETSDRLHFILERNTGLTLSECQREFLI